MEIGLRYQLDDPALHNRTRNLDGLHFRLLRLGWRHCSIVEARGSVSVCPQIKLEKMMMQIQENSTLSSNAISSIETLLNSVLTSKLRFHELYLANTAQNT